MTGVCSDPGRGGILAADPSSECQLTSRSTETVNRLTVMLLFFVLALGLFVRVWKLGSWPPLDGDVAALGVFALRGLAHGLEYTAGTHAYFFPLYVLVEMPFVALFGNTDIALRLLGLLCGLLTVWAAYATARRLWGPRAALMAAAAAAILPLSVVMGGRIGWEPSLAFPSVAWALYFAVVAWDRHSVGAAVVCGLLLALGTYVHPAAVLAVPGLAVGAIISGKLRPHLRQAVVATIVFALLSFPSVTVGRQVIASGKVNMRMFTHALGGMEEQRRTMSFAPGVVSGNLFRTLDHFTGVVTAQFLLGELSEPWRLPIKLLRAACVGLWLLVLAAAAVSGPFGRFIVGYIVGLFAMAHLSDPAFISLPDKGRYLLAAAVAIPLLMAYLTLDGGTRATRLARPAVFVIFAMWVGVTGVMLSFVHRDRTGVYLERDMTIRYYDRLVADYLERNVEPENDLVLCPWWSYWPISYYTAERVPLFSPDIASYDNIVVVTPDPADKRRVWWLSNSATEAPPFGAELVTCWPSLVGTDQSYAIWLADDAEMAIKWAVDRYLEIRAERRERIRIAD
jgi:4-amino-4-deoxy-L-arabinose transferase-like glycosyltransferase